MQVGVRAASTLVLSVPDCRRVHHCFEPSDCPMPWQPPWQRPLLTLAETSRHGMIGTSTVMTASRKAKGGAMAFNFKSAFRFTYRLLSKIGDPTFGWTPRRAGILLALYLLYPLFEFLVWLNLLLDDLFFRGYRRVEVSSPVFVVGNFRSGTTFLHRLLAKDEGRFSTMKMWEVLFAPSILGRKVVKAIANLDRWLGRLGARQVATMEEQWYEENVMHRVGLREPEEDDYLMLHIWSALTIGLSSGVLDEARPYAYFDRVLSKGERDRIMGFYRRCLQRHLYVHRSGQYLAKNPALTPKLDSVYDWFPDAKVICLVRSPLEAVPSFVNMMQFSWRVIGAPEESDALREFIVDMAQHWYRYPLERLEGAPDDGYIFVRYDDLVEDPAGTVVAVYERFGFEMSPAYARELQEEGERARQYRSRHRYSVEQTGLTREQLLATYQDVFDHFGFDTGESAGG